MRAYSLSHVRDDVLLRDLSVLVSQDRTTTATMLAHIAEVDARRLFAPAGYPSMHAYCVDELRLSEDAALRRIQAARAAREFPVLFEALADGRLHLTAVCLLATHLTPENVSELIGLATHRRKVEVQELLARRFPIPQLEGTVRVLPAVTAAVVLMEGLTPVDGNGCASGGRTEHALAHVRTGEHALAHVEEGEHALAHVADPVTPPPVERFIIQATVGRDTREKLRYAQALLSHAVPSGNIAQVLDRALDALIVQVEKRRFGTGSATRKRPRNRSNPETPYIPVDVRHAVFERDQGRCTFVGRNGHRCHASKFLQFDHVEPRARGGLPTVEGLRLRCRTHNQLEAERIFGKDFMARKREEARASAEEARARAAAETGTKEQIREVIAGLRNLDVRPPEARRAAEATLTLQHPTLEDRMRAALQSISPRRTYRPSAGG